MKFSLAIAVGLALTGCANDKEYVRKEIAESAAYIDRTCGKDAECRRRTEYAEFMRLDADLKSRAAAREAMSEALQNYAAQRQAAAAAYRPPTTTHCNKIGNQINCTSY